MRWRSRYPDHSGRNIVSPQRRHSLGGDGDSQSENAITLLPLLSFSGLAWVTGIKISPRAKPRPCLTFGSQARVILPMSVNNELIGPRLATQTNCHPWGCSPDLSPA